MPKGKDIELRNLVRRLDRRVLESILLQKHRQGGICMMDNWEPDEFENGYCDAGDMYRVINALPLRERLTVIPLVCKLWRDLMQSPIYWLYLDFYGFTCTGGWLQRRLKLAQVATGFISVLSDHGSHVLSIDIGNERLPIDNQLSVCKDNAFLKAILRLCPHIITLKIAGRSVTSAVLETAGQRQQLKRLYISETATGKFTPTEGFLKLLQKCPNLEELGFPARLLRCLKLNSESMKWIRNSLRESRGSFTSKTLLTKLEIKTEKNHFGGILYDVFRLLGNWFPELTEFITPNLVVGETVKDICKFSRLRALSIKLTTAVWIQGESKKNMQARASNCFSQILDACPILEDLRFGYSQMFEYPNILNIFLKKGCLETMKRLILQSAGLETEDLNSISSSGNVIAPRLENVQLNFCKVDGSNIEQIVKSLSPNLCKSHESKDKQHCFKSLQKSGSSIK